MHPFLLAFVGIASFALFFVLHLFLWQLPKMKRGLFLILKLSVLSVLLIGIVARVGLDLRLIDLVFVSLPVHLFLTLLYLHLYIGTFRSLSVRILNEIAKAGGSMTLEELERVYPLRFMFTSRFEILEKNKWFEKKGEAYVIAPKGRMFGRVIVGLRGVYGIKKAG